MDSATSRRGRKPSQSGNAYSQGSDWCDSLGGGVPRESHKWSIVCAAVFPYHMTSYDLREEGPARALHLGRAGRVMEWDMMQEEEEEDVGSRRKQNVLNSYTGVCVGVCSVKRH